MRLESVRDLIDGRTIAHAARKIRFALLALAMFTIGLAAANAFAQDAAFTGTDGDFTGSSLNADADLVTAVKEWTVLHLAAPPYKDSLDLPENSKMVPAMGFELHGAHPLDPNRFGRFTADGKWGVRKGFLYRSTGENGMIRLANAENFQLQGLVDASGLGGWFMMLGWDTGHGYLVYNVTMKESGSPWYLCEFRDGKGILNTYREFSQFNWRGIQPLEVSVQDGTLNIKAGRSVIARNEPLPNYHGGQVMVGTYNTQYGGKKLMIKSLRIRALDEEPEN